MHPDEQPTSVDLVRRLVAAQFPAWAGLPVAPVTSSATIHALYRLGDDLVARLPRLDHTDRQARLDRDWLPRLSPYLPLAVPEQVALGAPGEGYPFTWSVCRWLEGGEPGPDLDQDHAARSLGAFVAALSGIRGADGPLASVHGEHPQNIVYPEHTQVLRDVWVAMRASLREVLDHTTLEHLVQGTLPDSVTELLQSPTHWRNR